MDTKINNDSPSWKTDDDFYPADWEPKEKGSIKKSVPPPLPRKGEWHFNWFSNMLPLDEPFVYQNISYFTAENFYQSMKVSRDRTDLRRQIADMDAKKSKIAIRDKIKFPLDPEWTREKSIKVMEFALRKKFFPGTSWNKKLMETGEEELVEWVNWNDRFWGRDIATQKGENVLGRILMHLRKEYRETRVINKSSGEKGVSVMRGSPFGNKWTHIKDRNTLAEFIVETRKEAIQKFKENFLERVKTDRDFKDSVLKLKNETLMCCCLPKACHAEVIRDWLFEQPSFKYNKI